MSCSSTSEATGIDIAEVLEHALRELGVPDADADAWSVIDRVVAGPATRAAGARVLFAVLRRPSLELAFDLEPTARARLSRVLESEPDPHAAFSLEDDAGTLYHPAGARTHGAAATLSWTPAPPPRARTLMVTHASEQVAIDLAV